jgi:hypothetical protein
VAPNATPYLVAKGDHVWVLEKQIPISRTQYATVLIFAIGTNPSAFKYLERS